MQCENKTLSGVHRRHPGDYLTDQQPGLFQHLIGIARHRPQDEFMRSGGDKLAQAGRAHKY